jgi:hypothetical protein
MVASEKESESGERIDQNKYSKLESYRRGRDMVAGTYSTVLTEVRCRVRPPNSVTKRRRSRNSGSSGRVTSIRALPAYIFLKVQLHVLMLLK